MAEEYDDDDTALRPVDDNMSRDEALKALKSTQLYAMKLLDEVRRLRQEVSNLRAATPKKRGRGQDEDVLGYKGQIVGLAKAFLFTRGFFIDRAAFQKAKPDPPENARDQFLSDAAYTTSMAIALHEDIPSKFHVLLDAQTFSNFANDFLHEHSDGRSSFVSTLRKAMPTILKGLGIDTDLFASAKADRTKDAILAGPLKFPTRASLVASLCSSRARLKT
ncbi:hypothetical protein B0H13DRAFT_2354576 [Mycena leptocephala]|nr:hypothetical protein B0H13DRAFT_2354576 [Mycena leptocephala]